MTTTQEELERAVERLSEIAAAVEFAPGDGISLAETGAIKLATDLRLILSANREMREALQSCVAVLEVAVEIARLALTTQSEPKSIPANGDNQ